MLLNQNTGCVRIEQMSIGDQNRQRKRLADFRVLLEKLRDQRSKLPTA